MRSVLGSQILTLQVTRKISSLLLSEHIRGEGSPQAFLPRYFREKPKSSDFFAFHLLTISIQQQFDI